MPLQAFSFPIQETRIFRAANFIYKFKIRAGSSYSREEDLRDKCFNQELEGIIRSVLGNLGSLQPFSSAHFNIFPYKKRWEESSKVTCRGCEMNLKAYPFVLILYLEKNMQSGEQGEEKLSTRDKIAQQHDSISEPPSKCYKSEPPQEGATVKAESSGLMSGRLHVDKTLMGGEAQDDLADFNKTGISGFNSPRQKSCLNLVRGSKTPGEADPRLTNNMIEADDDEDEEGDDADSAPETPLRARVLTRLASHIFPFSLIFRNT